MVDDMRRIVQTFVPIFWVVLYEITTPARICRILKAITPGTITCTGDSSHSRPSLCAHSSHH